MDLRFEDLPDDYVLMAIDLGGLAISVVDSAGDEISDARAIRDRWLSDQTAAVLRVPSVPAPRGKNDLINPLHPQAKAATIAEIEDFSLDWPLWGKI